MPLVRFVGPARNSRNRIKRPMKANALYIQSGGPTAVINASAFGVIDEWNAKKNRNNSLYAVRYGNHGLVHGQFFDCSKLTKKALALLPSTPSMIFGSSRYRIPDWPNGQEEYEKILSNLNKYEIRNIFYNGGDGSVKACISLCNFLDAKYYECNVIFVPKTVDNDIDGIDHSPGFPSTARYVNVTISELVQDLRTYHTDVITVIEVMGRQTGWLAASTIVAQKIGFGPDLIYVPESEFSRCRLIADVSRVYASKGKCIAVVAEGVRDENGKYLFEYTPGGIAHPEVNMGGITPYLTSALKGEFGCKIRGIDIGLMQRCAGHLTSSVDVDEAIALGRFAVNAASNNETRKLVAIKRVSSRPYVIELETIVMDDAIHGGHLLPMKYLHGNRIADEYLDYIEPLIGDMPSYSDIRIK